MTVRIAPIAGSRLFAISWIRSAPARAEEPLMTFRPNGRTGTYVTKRGSKDSQVVRTIVTPAGSFRTISKDVFDRAMRSANTALKQGGPPQGDARKR